MNSTTTMDRIRRLWDHHQVRTIVKVRLKWVKNRGLDHIIDAQTDLKAACLLKDAMVRSTAGFLTSKSLEGTQKLLGLTVPTLRFVRRYPTLFREFPHPKWPSLVCFELTDISKLLHQQELKIHEQCEGDAVERLSRVLMMSRTKMMPLKSLVPLKWDLGLPDHFDKKLVEKFPDHFQLVRGTNGLACLKLVGWREEFAVSELQMMNYKSWSCSGNSDDGRSDGNVYREFKSRKATLEFPMSFPRGYGGQNKVKAWMEEFQKLPYISPYEDCRRIDPNSELMEKRVVGVLHEFLSLTIYKKTKRNYLRSLREELVLPHKFTRLFTRYPGIFYLSLKCKTTTIALREGYRRGRLVEPHPLARHRDKFHHVMRTGLVFRGKGIDLLPQLKALVDAADKDEVEYQSEEDVEFETNNRAGTSEAESETDDD